MLNILSVCIFSLFKTVDFLSLAAWNKLDLCLNFIGEGLEPLYCDAGVILVQGLDLSGTTLEILGCSKVPVTGWLGLTCPPCCVISEVRVGLSGCTLPGQTSCFLHRCVASGSSVSRLVTRA